MFAFGKKRARNLVMRVGGRCDGSCIDQPDEFVEGLCRCGAELYRNGAIANGIDVIDCGELSGPNLRIQPSMIAPDMANPNNTNAAVLDRKSTRLNSSHRCISYAVFCLKKKTTCP